MDIVSKKTRRMFTDHLSGWGTLRIIDGYFMDQDIQFIDLTDQEKFNLGQRRALVSGYYKSIDWENISHVSKVIKVFETILNDTDDSVEYLKPIKEKLITALQSDGFIYENNRLTQSGGLPTPTMNILEQTQIINKTQLQLHMDRIENSIESDPELAIGNAKELLETICKNILDQKKIMYTKNNDLPDLMKMLCKELKLTPDDVHENAKGAETIRKVLGNLTVITTGVAELRNLYGTGHGKGKMYKGLGARHARLAVGASYVLATFLIETIEERE